MAKAFQLEFATKPGGVQLSRIFAGLEEFPKDLTEPLEKVSDDYYETQKKTFASGGSFEGKPAWKALSQRYAVDKANEAPGQGILVRTGILRDAATDKEARGAIHNLTKKTLEVGIDIKVEGGWNLAALHTVGTETMPKRPPILFSKPERNRWVRFFRDFFGEGLKDAVGAQPRKFQRVKV